MDPDRAALAADLQRARGEFHALLAAATEQDWDAPTDGTRWSNEQLLFHIAFGYMVARRLLPLVRLVSRLPAPAGRGFARLLNSAARPFHAVNYHGSRAAARVYNRHRMGEKLDREITALQRSLARETDAGLRRSMPFPTRWDPFFAPRMSIADLYRYPGQHLGWHQRQLTLGRPR